MIRKGCSVLIFAAAVLFILASFAEAEPALPARRGSAVFTVSAPRDTLFTLPVTWVVFDSIRVFRNQIPQAEYTHWRIADPGNRIWLYRPLGRLDTLRVEYLYRPIPLCRTYVRHSLRDLGRSEPERDTLRVISVRAVERSESPGWSRLNKSGSLIRSVQIGTGQDLELESALNLQIDGRVGRDVDVVAVLTDQSTPIQPEGTTESLSELEKVFVSIRSPHVSTTLGDYVLDLPGGRYDTYSRKLTGVLGEVRTSSLSATANGAVSRGEYQSNQFYGQEANQGPYPLTGKNGELGVLVLAGTEKVWLDGELLRRGEGNDYVIDYAAGEVTFTSRRVITSDSRIVVDFEYSNQDYERFYSAGRFEGEFGSDRFGGAVTWITESDDRTRPLGFSMTDEDRTVLERAGDNQDSAAVSSADSIGLGGGDYALVDTSSNGETYRVFVFQPRDSAGNPSGQWRVFFDDFGAGNGEYQATADERGVTYFEWVGLGLGRYLPLRRLALPERHNLTDVRLHGQPAGGVTLSAELALSEQDHNVLSGRDDADNDGAAFYSTAAFSRSRPNLFGIRPHSVDLGLQYRQRNKEFRDITRSSEIEFDREWDAAQVQGFEETITEASARLSPVEGLSFSGGFGRLHRPDILTTDRLSTSASLVRGNRLNANLSHLQILSDDSTAARKGDWIRQNGRVSVRLGRFSPRCTVNRERRRDENRYGLYGFRYLDYHTGLGVELPYQLSLDGDFQRRIDEQLTTSDSYQDSARAYTLTTEAAWRPSGGGWTLLRYAHREKRFASTDSESVTTDVGRLESLIAPRHRVIEANIVYEVAKTQTQNQVLIAVEVEPGTGDYRLEGSQYVPDDQGDYILVPRNTGSYEPATDLTLSSRIWLRPDEWSNDELSPLLKKLSAETDLTIEEQTRRNLTAQMLLLNQAYFRGDSTLIGRLSLRQDLHVQRLSRKLSVRFRYTLSRSLDNQYLNGGQERSLQSGGVRVRARYLASLRGETDLTVSQEKFNYVTGVLPSRDINRFEVTQDLTKTLSRVWEVGCGITAADVDDERTAVQVTLRELKPRVVYSLLAKGRFDAEFTWTRASSNKAVIPYELARGANRGNNYRWSARGTYQFAGNFSSSLNYTGRQDSGERTYHTGRLEVRATF